MKTATRLLLGFLIAVVIDTTFLYVVTDLLGTVPPGPALQHVTDNLLYPIEMLDIAFLMGAIISGFLAVPSRNHKRQSPL